MKILITGGAGYIGNILVEELLKRENKNFRTPEVTVYDNLKYKQNCLLQFCNNPSFRFIKGDVRDKNKLLSEISTHDVIIPLAAIVGFPACEKDKSLATQVNYEQLEFIVKNATRDQRIVYPNTNSGYGVGKGDGFCTEETPLNPISHYGVTKCDAENAVLGDRRGISLRLATVFGASQRMRLDLLVNDFVYKAMFDKYIVLFEHAFKRNFIHVRDVAHAFMHMIHNYNENMGEAFNVGLSDCNISKMELCNTIKETIPDFVIKTDDFAKDPDKRDYIVLNDKIEKTGWSAEHSLTSGIEELIKAYSIVSESKTQFTNL
jgi:nucleoside-diphosphate-sugar epimerase